MQPNKIRLKDINPVDLQAVGLLGNTVTLYRWGKRPVKLRYKHLRSAKQSMAKWVWYMRKEI